VVLGLSTLQAETIDFYNRTFTSGIINQSDLLLISLLLMKAVGGKHKRYVFKTNGGVASAIIKLKTPLTQLLRQLHRCGFI
jgi:hypothetical protein